MKKLLKNEIVQIVALSVGIAIMIAVIAIGLFGAAFPVDSEMQKYAPQTEKAAEIRAKLYE